MSTHTAEPTSSPDTADQPPHRAEYVAFLHRAPYALDAWRLGFAVGTREDYALRDHRYPGLDLPVWMLDNDFRDADLDRYLDRLRDQDPTPRVAVLGDAESASEARDLLAAARTLRDEIGATTRPVIVAKAAEVLGVLPRREVVVGYPNGYADVHGRDVAPAPAWAGHDIHILGGSPPTAWAAIRRLTRLDEQRTLAAFASDVDEPANVVGLDYNGIAGVAYRGDYWHHERPHWRSADALTIRATIRRGLGHIRTFWRERGVWPASTPRDDHGPVLGDADPFDAVCAGCGADLLDPTDRVVRQLDGGDVLAFCDQRCIDWFERETPLHPLDPDHVDPWHETAARPSWMGAE